MTWTMKHNTKPCVIHRTIILCNSKWYTCKKTGSSQFIELGMCVGGGLRHPLHVVSMTCIVNSHISNHYLSH